MLTTTKLYVAVSVSLIKGHPDWEVCAEAGNGRQAVEKAKESRPDIAILDIGMPVLNGLEATRQILRETPGTRILILTITDTDQAVQAVLDAGARGFLLKSNAARDLVTAVEALQHNKTFFTARVAELVLSGFLGKTHRSSRGEPALPGLTSREREVVQLLAEGKSTKEVASHLNLSVKTAETHRSNIIESLDCTRSASWCCTRCAIASYRLPSALRLLPASGIPAAGASLTASTPPKRSVRVESAS